MAEVKILVATDGTMAHVRVKGRATYECGDSLRAFGLAQIAAGMSQIVIDLGDCEGMDSTFMGILSMIAIRGMPKKAKVYIVNAQAHAIALLEGLGLKKLFCFGPTTGQTTGQTSEGRALAEICPGAADGGDQLRIVLEAHEALMAADSANVARFKDVVAYLQEDLKRQQGGAAASRQV